MGGRTAWIVMLSAYVVVAFWAPRDLFIGPQGEWWQQGGRKKGVTDKSKEREHITRERWARGIFTEQKRAVTMVTQRSGCARPP
jgi:uncharacterized membrane protein